MCASGGGACDGAMVGVSTDGWLLRCGCSGWCEEDWGCAVVVGIVVSVGVEGCRW